jgi:uncharacterized protein YbjT (DUF2867 family)
MARSLEKMSSRNWACDKNVELIAGDVQNPQALMDAAKDCSVAYYLVHSMISKNRQFAEADRISAMNMKRAAESNQLEQIIYLGGLGDIRHPNLSHHIDLRL